jgi:hypothetical protein
VDGLLRVEAPWMDGGNDAVVRCPEESRCRKSIALDKCVGISIFSRPQPQRYIHKLNSTWEQTTLVWSLSLPYSFHNNAIVTAKALPSSPTTMHGHTLLFLAALAFPVFSSPVPINDVSNLQESNWTWS